MLLSDYKNFHKRGIIFMNNLSKAGLIMIGGGIFLFGFGEVFSGDKNKTDLKKICNTTDMVGQTISACSQTVRSLVQN